MSARTDVEIPDFLGFELVEHVHRFIGSGSEDFPSQGCDDAGTMFELNPAAAGDTIVIERPNELFKASEDDS